MTSSLQSILLKKGERVGYSEDRREQAGIHREVNRLTKQFKSALKDLGFQATLKGLKLDKDYVFEIRKIRKNEIEKYDVRIRLKTPDGKKVLKEFQSGDFGKNANAIRILALQHLEDLNNLRHRSPHQHLQDAAQAGKRLSEVKGYVHPDQYQALCRQLEDAGREIAHLRLVNGDLANAIYGKNQEIGNLEAQAKDFRAQDARNNARIQELEASIAGSQGNNEQLKAELAQRQEQQRALEAHKAGLIENLARKEEQNRDLGAKLDALNAQLGKMQEAAGLADQEIARLKAAEAAKQNEIEDLTNKLAAGGEQNAELIRKLQLAKDELEQLRRQFGVQFNQIEGLEKNKKVLEGDAIRREKAFKDADEGQKKTIAKLQADITKLIEARANLSSELEQARRDGPLLAEATQENKILKEQLDRLNKRLEDLGALEAKLKRPEPFAPPAPEADPQLLDQLRAREAQVRDLTEQLAQKEAQRNRLEEANLQLIDRTKQQIAALSEQKDQLQRQLADQTIAVRKARDASEAIGKELQVERKRSEELPLQIRELQAQLNDKTQQLAQLQQTHRAEAEKRAQEMRSLRHDIEGLKAKNCELQQAYDARDNRVKKLMEEKQETLGIIDGLNHQLEELREAQRQAAAKHADEMAQLQGRIAGLDAEQARLQNTLEAAQSHGHQLEGDLGRLQEQHDQLQQRLGAAQTNEVRLERALGEKGQALDALRDELTQAQAQANGLRADMQAGRRELDEARALHGELEGKLAGLEADKRGLKDELDKAHRGSEEHYRGIERLTAEIKQLREEDSEKGAASKELEQLTARLKAELAALHGQAPAREHEMARLAAELKDKTEAHQAGQRELEAARKSRSGLEAELAQLAKNVSDISADAEEAREGVKDLTAKLEAKEREFAQASHKLGQVNDDSTDFKREIAETRSSLEASKAQIAKLNEEIKQTHAAHDAEKAARSKEANQELQHIQGEKADLLAQINKLTTRVKVLEAGNEYESDFLTHAEEEQAAKLRKSKAELRVLRGQLQAFKDQLKKVAHASARDVEDVRLKTFESIKKLTELLAAKEAQVRKTEHAMRHHQEVGDLKDARIKELEMKLEAVTAELANKQAAAVHMVKEPISHELREAQARQEGLTSKLAQLQGEYSRMLQEKEHELASRNGAIAALRKAFDEAKRELKAIPGAMKELKEAHDADLARLSELLKTRKARPAHAEATPDIVALRNELAQKQSEWDFLNARNSSLNKKVKELEAQIKEAQAKESSAGAAAASSPIRKFTPPQAPQGKSDLAAALKQSKTFQGRESLEDEDIEDEELVAKKAEIKKLAAELDAAKHRESQLKGLLGKAKQEYFDLDSDHARLEGSLDHLQQDHQQLKDRFAQTLKEHEKALASVHENAQKMTQKMTRRLKSMSQSGPFPDQPASSAAAGSSPQEYGFVDEILGSLQRKDSKELQRQIRAKRDKHPPHSATSPTQAEIQESLAKTQHRIEGLKEAQRKQEDKLAILRALLSAESGPPAS